MLTNPSPLYYAHLSVYVWALHSFQVCYVQDQPKAVSLSQYCLVGRKNGIHIAFVTPILYKLSTDVDRNCYKPLGPGKVNIKTKLYKTLYETLNIFSSSFNAIRYFSSSFFSKLCKFFLHLITCLISCVFYRYL